MTSQSRPEWPAVIAGFLEYHPGPLTILQIATQALSLTRGTISTKDKANIGILAQRAGWKRHGSGSGFRTFTRPEAAA